MSTLMKIVAAIALLVAVGLGALAFTVLRTPEQASAPIEAIPLTTSTTSEVPVVTTVAVSSPTEVSTIEAAIEPGVTAEAAIDATVAAEVAVEATAATEPSGTEPATPAETTASTEGASEPVASPILAQIVQGESEARFIIHEVLNNAPKTVIGTTDQVAGEISVDPSNPANTKVGVIQVNARTLATDSDFRNRAIKNAILETDTYEFITFIPTTITGLPQSGVVGQSYTFQILGDLTIRDVTKPVTFDVTANPVSDARLEGTATTTILYKDFGITIPSVPAVASVEDDVRLELDFVATPVQ
jgi:polyisoprenoid-binding protein YceI